MGSVHTHFVHSISNYTVDQFDRLHQCTYFVYWLFDDKIAPYSTSHILRYRIHRIFISHYPLHIYIVCALIKTNCFNMINCRIWDWINKRNAPLNLTPLGPWHPLHSKLKNKQTKRERHAICITKALFRVLLKRMCTIWNFVQQTSLFHHSPNLKKKND